MLTVPEYAIIRDSAITDEVVMNCASFSQDDVLEQLDICAHAGEFPMLDNGHIYLADTRLSAYGDTKCWAIVIEVLGANNALGNHYSIHNCLYCFGNCILRSIGTRDNDVLHPTTDGPDEPTFQTENEWYADPNVRTLRIRNNIVQITTDPNDLEAMGIILVEPPDVTVIDVLRSLLPKYRDLLFATESELSQLVPSELPLLIRLNAWNHPDLAEGEKPSESRAFQMLATVLITGDPSRYQPSAAPNTHWTDWPDAGTL